MGLADLPTILPLLGSELCRILPSDLLASLAQRLLAGDQFDGGYLQALAPAVVAARLGMEYLAAIAEPALLWRRQWAVAIADAHGRLRPPPAPSPAAASCHQSSPGSGVLGARHGRLAPDAADR